MTGIALHLGMNRFVMVDAPEVDESYHIRNKVMPAERSIISLYYFIFNFSSLYFP